MHLSTVETVLEYQVQSPTHFCFNIEAAHWPTQKILSEKLEVIRLYNWDQVNTSGYIPTTFVEYQYPNDDTNMVAQQGIAYRGTIQLSAADVHPNYTNTMRKVVATVNWTSQNVTNQQRMETFISEFGVQKYVY